MSKHQLLSIGWNLLFVLGAASVAFGLWLAYRPLGFIAAGLIVAILGYGGGLEQFRKGRRR